jgi:hypothetical protein
LHKWKNNISKPVLTTNKTDNQTKISLNKNFNQKVTPKLKKDGLFLIKLSILLSAKYKVED